MSPVSRRHLIISVTLLIVAVSLWLLGLTVISKKAETLSSQLETIDRVQKQEIAYFQLQKVEEESRENREQLSHYFLKQGSDSIDFLNKVESLAPASGVILQTKSLEEEIDKKTKASWIKVTFDFSGSRSDVERFISILEHLPYLTKVTRVEMGALTLDRWSATVTMRVHILSYVQ